MADLTAVNTWTTNEVLTASDLNTEFSNVYNNVVTKGTAQTISGIKTHSAAVIFQDNINLTFGTGSDATIDYDGTNLVIDPKVVGSGVLSLQGGLTVGVNDTGYDVQFFGATSGAYMQWDESADTLIMSAGTTLSIDSTTDSTSGTTGSIHTDGGLGVAKDIVSNAEIWGLTGGFGIARTDGTLHVHTATAGTVAAHAVADDLVVENSTSGGITILTPDANPGNFYFGTPSDNLNAGFESHYNAGSPYLTLNVAAGVERMRINGSGNVGIGDASPGGKLSVVLASETDPSSISAWGTKHAVFGVGGASGANVGIGYDQSNNAGLLIALDPGTAWKDMQYWAEEHEWYHSGATLGMKLDTSGNVGIGTSSPDGTLHVHTATAGSVAANVNYDELTIENSGNGGMTFLVPDASTSAIAFGSVTANAGALINWNYDARTMNVGTNTANGVLAYTTGAGTEVGRWAGLNLFIGDTTNANMTVGLTIDQSTNDNEILTLQSSTDVTHGMTTTTETETFGFFSKVEAPNGGLRIDGLTQGTTALRFIGHTSGEITTHTSSTIGNVHFQCSLKSGTASDVHQAEAAIYTVANHGTTRLVLQGEGEMHITNTTLVALDDDDDNQIVRAMQKASASGGIIETAHDNPAYSYSRLQALGLAGEKDADGTFLRPLQKTLHAHEGAMWQNHCMALDNKDAVLELREELNEERTKRIALETQIKGLLN
jgi:hypothetical protein